MGTLKGALGFMAVALAVIVVACGGDNNSNDVPAADDTSRDITDEQLSQMVLAPTAFGPEYAEFTPDAENGPQTIEQASEGEDDPAAERIDLEQFGWAATHKAYFDNAAPREGAVSAVASILYVFGTAEGASGYLRDSRGEMQDEANAPDPGQTMELAELEVGNEAYTAVFDAQVDREDGSTVEVSGMAAFFRRGRIAGGVYYIGVALPDLEKQRLEGKVTSLTSTMNDRMASILAAAPPAAAEQ